MAANATRIARATEALAAWARDAGRGPSPGGLCGCPSVSGEVAVAPDPEIRHQPIDHPALEKRNRQEQHRLNDEAEQSQQDRPAIRPQKLGLKAAQKSLVG